VAGVAIAILASCVPHRPRPLTEMEEDVLSVVEAAWDLEKPAEACRLDELYVSQPESAEQYLMACPPDSGACLRWSYDDGKFRTVPVIVINPAARDDPARLAVHELLHAYVACSKGPWPDLYDYGHTNTAVWGRIQLAAKRALATW
jgi:hypothetical protein